MRGLCMNWRHPSSPPSGCEWAAVSSSKPVIHRKGHSAGLIAAQSGTCPYFKADRGNFSNCNLMYLLFSFGIANAMWIILSFLVTILLTVLFVIKSQVLWSNNKLHFSVLPRWWRCMVSWLWECLCGTSWSSQFFSWCFGLSYLLFRSIPISVHGTSLPQERGSSSSSWQGN